MPDQLRSFTCVRGPFLISDSGASSPPRSCWPRLLWCWGVAVCFRYSLFLLTVFRLLFVHARVHLFSLPVRFRWLLRISRRREFLGGKEATGGRRRTLADGEDTSPRHPAVPPCRATLSQPPPYRATLSCQSSYSEKGIVPPCRTTLPYHLVVPPCRAALLWHLIVPRYCFSLCFATLIMSHCSATTLYCHSILPPY